MAEATNDPNEEGVIRLLDLDVPIFRIVPRWLFENMLRSPALTLVQPHRWEDPYEAILAKIQIVDPTTEVWGEAMLESFLSPAYAQCWSMTEESDTLLRAYSRVTIDPYFKRNIEPRHEGVRIRSTPRKLLLAARKWAAQFPGVTVYIGKVAYASRDNIHRYIAGIIRDHGAPAVGRSPLMAKLMLLKRSAFSHEAEVRLICIDERKLVAPPEVISVPFTLSDLIEEVAFDPRLVTFERNERIELAKALGYCGNFADSELYQNTFLEVVLQSPESARLTFPVQEPLLPSTKTAPIADRSAPPLPSDRS